jgi:hypothetical protein
MAVASSAFCHEHRHPIGEDPRARRRASVQQRSEDRIDMAHVRRDVKINSDVEITSPPHEMKDL